MDTKKFVFVTHPIVDGQQILEKKELKDFDESLYDERYEIRFVDYLFKQLPKHLFDSSSDKIRKFCGLSDGQPFFISDGGLVHL